MPKDIFPGWGKGPSKDDIEREAARELDRLTRAPGPAAFDPDAPGPGVGGFSPGGVGAIEGPSPLEEMAASVSDRRRQRRRGKGLRPLEDQPSGPGGGFAGPAAITGSVGSSLGFGGGVAPGTRATPPPPDAQPLRRGSQSSAPPPEEPVSYGRRPDYDDDSDDDDLGITEMALRDHAERFGADLSDKVIRSDPIAAESMREQAMRQFLERQAGRGGTSAPQEAPGLRIRRPGTRPGAGVFSRLRVARDEEADEDAGAQAVDDTDLEEGTDEYEEIDEVVEADEIDDELDDEDEDEEPPPPPDAQAAEETESIEAVDRRARIAEERLEVAEERARIAEKRAAVAEERAEEAEREVQELARLIVELEAMLEEAGVQPDEVEAEPEDVAAAEPVAKKAAPTRKRAAKRAAPAETTAKKAAAPKRAAKAVKSAKAAKKAAKPVAKKAGPARKRAAKTMEPPPAPEAADGQSALGGILGRRRQRA